MSAREELERFAADVARDEALRHRVKALGSDQQAVVDCARSLGYGFTMADVTSLGDQLSEAELEGVSGGLSWAAVGARPAIPVAIYRVPTQFRLLSA